MAIYIGRIELYNFNFIGKLKEVRFGDLLICSPPANARTYHEEVGPDGKPWYSGTANINFPAFPYVDLEYESDPEHYVEQARKLCQRLVTLLRLFKKGRVHGVPYRIWDKLVPGDFLDTLIKDFSKVGLVTTRHMYELGDNDIEKLQSFFKALAEVDQSSFSVAISRFNDSYTREEDRDRFIDLLIALEALFGESGDSVGYKIRLRCACFLGRFPEIGEDKRQVFDFLKEAYDKRSDILHGRRKSLDWTSGKTCLKLENLVRQSIVHMLLEAKAGNVLTPDKLDQFLFL